jgi:uncharacterized RDD family membrane protein YckC
MDWTNKLRMETPEQIELDMELAGLGSRFFAQVIDWIIKFLLGLIFLIILLMVAAGTAFAKRIIGDPTTVGYAIVVFAFYLMCLGYGIVFEAFRNGRTPGKWCLGIRVIRQTGSSVDFVSAGIRNFLAIADFAPALLLGPILIQSTNRRQRLGDMAAGTIVIREREMELGNEPDKAMKKFATEEYRFTQSHLTGLTYSDRTILREFMRRCVEMEKVARSRLARKLADHYLDKTGYQLEYELRTGPEARDFLASLLRDLQEYLKFN